MRLGKNKDKKIGAEIVRRCLHGQRSDRNRVVGRDSSKILNCLLAAKHVLVRVLPRLNHKSTMAHDVFISYSAVDKLIAFAVCTALEGARVRCWMYDRDNRPGWDYADVIVEAIESSRILVLIYSESSNVSLSVRREVNLAAEARLHIVNFRVADTPLSRGLRFHLGNIHWLDALTPPMEGHYVRLVQAVKDLLSIHPISTKPPAGEPVSTQVANSPLSADPDVTVKRETPTDPRPGGDFPVKREFPFDESLQTTTDLHPEDTFPENRRSEPVKGSLVTDFTNKSRRRRKPPLVEAIILLVLLAAAGVGIQMWRSRASSGSATVVGGELSVATTPSNSRSPIEQQKASSSLQIQSNLNSTISPMPNSALAPAVTPAPTLTATPTIANSPAVMMESTPTASTESPLRMFRTLQANQYKTIQAAIDDAQPGETVHIPHGNYIANFKFKSGIYLVGDGMSGAKATVISSPASNGDVLTVSHCNSGWISDIAFEHLDRNGTKNVSVGVRVEDSGVYLRRCRVSHTKGSGIICFDKDHSSIQDCEVNDSGEIGIFVLGTGTMTGLYSNACHGNGGDGIYVGHDAAIQLQANTCTGNAFNGIGLHSGGLVVNMRENHCTDNKGYGICIGQEVDLILAANAPELGSNVSGPVLYDKRTRQVPSTQYKTIQSAINAANPNDIVHVAKGSYDEAVRFKQGVILEGEGKDLTVVNAPVGEGQALLVDECNAGDISKIAFLNTNNGSSADTFFHAVQLRHSHVELHECRAQSTQNCGVVSVNQDTSLVYDCDMRDCGQDGIWVSGVGTSPTLTNNISSNNKYQGLTFAQGAGGRAEDNLCTNNHQNGIQITGAKTFPELVGNRCVNNELYGISITEGSKVKVSEVDLKLFVGNKKGKLYHEPCTLLVPSDNYKTIQSAIDDAFLGDTVQVEAGTYNESLVVNKAIKLCGKGVEGNKITIVRCPSTQSGVLYVAKCDGGEISNFCFEQTEPASVPKGIKRNFYDAVDLEGSNVELHHCHVSNSKNSGIWAHEGDRSRVHDCEVVNCGITVGDKGTATLFNTNTVKDSFADGVVYLNGAGGEFDNGTLIHNKYRGIAVTGKEHDDTAPKLIGNTITGNAFEGICYFENTGGRAERNRCESNGGAGIAIFSKSRTLVLTGNICLSNGGYGIFRGEGVVARIDDTNVLSPIGAARKAHTPNKNGPLNPLQ